MTSLNCNVLVLKIIAKFGLQTYIKHLPIREVILLPLKYCACSSFHKCNEQCNYHYDLSKLHNIETRICYPLDRYNVSIRKYIRLLLCTGLGYTRI